MEDEMQGLDDSITNCYDNILKGFDEVRSTQSKALFTIAEAINNLAASVALINKNTYKNKWDIL